MEIELRKLHELVDVYKKHLLDKVEVNYRDWLNAIDIVSKYEHWDSDVEDVVKIIIERSVKHNCEDKIVNCLVMLGVEVR